MDPIYIVYTALGHGLQIWVGYSRWGLVRAIIRILLIRPRFQGLPKSSVELLLPRGTAPDLGRGPGLGGRGQPLSGQSSKTQASYKAGCHPKLLQSQS